MQQWTKGFASGVVLILVIIGVISCLNSTNTANRTATTSTTPKSGANQQVKSVQLRAMYLVGGNWLGEVCKSADEASRFNDAITHNDHDAFIQAQLKTTCGGTWMPGKTYVSVIGQTDGAMFVKVIGGFNADQTGWVPTAQLSILPSSAPSRTGWIFISDDDNSQIPICPSEAALDKWFDIKFNLHSSHISTPQEAATEASCGLASSYTRASILKQNTNGHTQVQVITGPLVGQTGWIISEWVHVWGQD